LPSRRAKPQSNAANGLADVPVSQPVSPAAPVLPRGGPGQGRIFLIDTMSFIFRAYHAMARQRPMSTKTGVPTAATYVFVNMLRKLRDDFAPEYLAAVFDVAAPTFRDRQAASISKIRKFDIKTQSFQEVDYAGYKAQREQMPLDLAQQVPYIRRALEAFRIPTLEMPGFEADDVIGTLARKAAEHGYPVYVVSSDKDMLQLVSDGICVLNPPKDNLVCDRAKVEEILGVPPERVVDVMALRGDSIDNIPGAPGIGDKGSVELIRRFGSVEAALDHASEVEKKTYRESLLNNREAVMFSKQMATIDCDVPVDLDVEAMRAQDPDVDACRELFTELEFSTLLKEFVSGVQVSETHYSDAESADRLAAVLRTREHDFPLALAIDVQQPAAELADESGEADSETAELALSLAAASPPPGRKIAISPAPGVALTIAVDGPAGAAAMAALADEHTPKAVHDYKTMLHALQRAGHDLGGVQHDSMLYSYLLDPTYSSHRLPDVVLRRFNLNATGTLPESADMTGRLAVALRRDVEEAGLLRVYDNIDLPLVRVLARMEDAGIKVDRAALAGMAERLEAECAAKAREIHQHSGVEFNINSPRQLGEILFNRLALPKPVKYGKGKTVSTAVDVLEQLALTHEVPRLVLHYRQLSKLKSTYVDALPLLVNSATGRVHTSFGQAGTATGRLSSTNPNLQNIPVRTELGREIRAAFIADPGCMLMSADYSQIELRLLGHFSEDSLLVEAYRRGDDIHTLTASQVFGVPPLLVNAEHRRRAKVVNFGIVYGLSPFGLSQNLQIDTSEAKRFIDAYFEKYAGVRAYLDRTLEEARKTGRVTTLFGRMRPINDINSKNYNMRGFAERTAVNTPLQGTAADLIKLAMIRIDTVIREQKFKSSMLLQVHDELVFEVPEDEMPAMRTLVREQMENVHRLKVPLLVEIGVGPNWRDLEFD
jgi:DNA polymerase-1